MVNPYASVFFRRARYSSSFNNPHPKFRYIRTGSASGENSWEEDDLRAVKREILALVMMTATLEVTIDPSVPVTVLEPRLDSVDDQSERQDKPPLPNESNGNNRDASGRLQGDPQQGGDGALTSKSSSTEKPTTATASPLEELFDCAKQGNLPRFQHLVTLYGVDLARSRDAAGHTTAHWVAQRGNAAFLEYLSSLDVPMDAPSLPPDRVGLHPIHWACASGNLAAVRALVLKLGVDVNTVDVLKRRSPLLIAAQNGHPLLVLFLVKHGADLTLVDADGDSAIHWAAYKGATEIVAVFQYLRLSSDAPDAFGMTPLHLAAMRGALATVQFLVEELDADIMVQDKQGRSPLALSKIKGHRMVERYLVKRMTGRQWWNLMAMWERSRAPYHFALVNAAVGTMLYVTVLMRKFPELSGFCVPHLMWNALAWAFFALTVRSSPGDVSKDEKWKLAYSEVTNALIQSDNGGNGEEDGEDGDAQRLRMMEQPLCHSCHVQRPLRAKHCRVCKTCVHVFDHHCPFVDNCIGRDNYVPFMAFVGALVIDLIATEIVLFRAWQLTHGLHVWWLPLCAVYIAGLFVPVAYLFGFHVYLSARNLTTNEVINAHRYQHQGRHGHSHGQDHGHSHGRSGHGHSHQHGRCDGDHGRQENPFDRGLVSNLAERCLPAFVATEPGEEAKESLLPTARKQKDPALMV